MATYIKRKTGWLAQIRRKGHDTICRTFDTKAEAERWAIGVESKMGEGRYEDNREALTTTLSECLARYETEVTVSKKGAEQERYRIALWLRDDLANKPIGAIKSSDMAKWRDARIASGASSGTVRLDLALISNLYTIAIQEWGLPVINPVMNIRKPSPGKARDRCLLPGEEDKILGVCSSEMRIIVILAIETAMRRGEIIGLRHEMISGKVITLPDTKNGTVRKVPLSKRALAVLSEIPRRLDGKVFSYTEHGCTQMFVKYCQRLSIKDLRFHDLRHHALTRMAENGLNVMELKAISGHKCVQMLSRYVNVNINNLADKLD
jgi:integrase